MTGNDTRKARIAAIYSEDEHRDLRKSHENPAVQKLYADFLGHPLNPLFVGSWDTAMRLTSFAVLAWTLSQIRTELNKEKNPKVRINTIAFVSSADTDTTFIELLRRIARENGGNYRHVSQERLQ